MIKALFATLGSVLLLVGVSACGDDDNGYSPYTSPTQKISCSTGYGSTLCSCNLGYSTGYSATCAPVASTDICCADSGWPSYGSCSCKKTDEVKCATHNDGSYTTCSCSTSETSGSATDICYPTGTRSPTPSTSGSSSGGVCCKTSYSCTCYAYSATCSSGTEVSTCTARDYPAATCASYQQQTSSCSGYSAGGSSSSSSGSSSYASLVTGTFTTDSKTSSGPTVTRQMSLTQSGSSVSGEYIPSADPYGTLSGTMQGNTLTGTWSQGAASGPIEFVFSPDGSSFTGTWDYAGGPGTYSWRGRRTSTSPTSLKPSGGSGGGCSGNSDCGTCERCELSTGNCVAKLTCN